MKTGRTATVCADNTLMASDLNLALSLLQESPTLQFLLLLLEKAACFVANVF